MHRKDDKQIRHTFWQRQGRQFLAIAASLFLVLFLAIVSKRSDLFGEYPGSTIVVLQLVVISAFIGFTAINWRCPSCKKYIGNNITRRACKHCGARLR